MNTRPYGLPFAKIHPPEIEQVMPDIDALSYLQGVYRGTIIPNPARLSAARAAVEFEKPKLRAVIVGEGLDLVDLLNAAVERSRKCKEDRLQPRLPSPTDDQSSTPTSEAESLAPLRRP